ncbi:MAG: hypothetical protein IT364_02940 [Candidatus Hydrogenedentes bacterium]|nr:hypothetical protein [Candidatus Hydrogenedentota bacterium]
MTSFKEICEMWGDDRALAEDVGQSLFAVQKWRIRNKIPAHQWRGLVDAAQRRGFSQITLELLARVAEQRASAA